MGHREWLHDDESFQSFTYEKADARVCRVRQNSRQDVECLIGVVATVFVLSQKSLRIHPCSLHAPEASVDHI